MHTSRLRNKRNYQLNVENSETIRVTKNILIFDEDNLIVVCTLITMLFPEKTAASIGLNML